MPPKRSCSHDRARLHSVQRLGTQPPVELWHCPVCKSTISAESRAKVAGAVAAT